MGVKGLQSFLDRCCPEACVTVSLSQMSRQHAAKVQQGCKTQPTPAVEFLFSVWVNKQEFSVLHLFFLSHLGPTLVVDGMACLRHWYSCKDWVCGGQWREYVNVLKSWVEAFNSAGIRLVFFFDGVVEEQKRKEWVKRRRRVNGDVAKIFRHVKAHGEQPGRDLFCLPSGLAAFTPFVLSAPYLSVAKLRIDSLITVLYDRQMLCQIIGLDVTQLPLLACLLGNDVVSEEQMQHIRNNAMATYRCLGMNSPAAHSGPPQGQMVLAVSHLVGSLRRKEEEGTELIPQSLNLTAPQKELLKRGICSYLLPGQEALQQGDISALPSTTAFEKYVSPEILKTCREKHIAAEGFMVYSVVCEGVTQCSNTLEDEEDTELLPQALVYKPCRQCIYGLLLLHGHDDSCVDLPTIREWFVYRGNPLKEPDMVQPVSISLPCDQPSLDLLWFDTGPEVSALRLMSFLSVFDCQEFSELCGVIEDSLLAALCLITYIVLQVQTLSQEDTDAYLSQAVCLRLKSFQELQQIKLPFLCSRAVQLGSLYVRGLSHLLGANCASGCPLPNAALMPWHSFDGRLFHSKYLLAHSGMEKTVLLDSDVSGDGKTKRGICVCVGLLLVRAGGREERCQEAINMEEDGERGEREETPVNMKIERDCGGEGANIFTLTLVPILTAMTADPRTRAILQNGPEADHVTSEGATGWPQGNTAVGFIYLLL
ncbi:hypothetical protein L3Q82_008951 [Scortum barcoo]|uniref:Uncharacterized protein n=1 Tax=Scortum barcoo TaxID=214431 RepID=A0ACB8XCQ0_9TELE|nr:hypothetical protein L3Q82_008951 [Scortum barcoo]